MLDEMSVSRVLVVAPLRPARDTWPAEVEKWDHLKDLDVSVIVGDAKTRITALNTPALRHQHLWATRMTFHTSGALAYLKGKTIQTTYPYTRPED